MVADGPFVGPLGKSPLYCSSPLTDGVDGDTGWIAVWHEPNGRLLAAFSTGLEEGADGDSTVVIREFK